MYCTMDTKAYTNRGRDFVTDLVFGEVKQTQNGVTPKILDGAIRYVCSTDLVEFDLKWLHALFDFLSNYEGIACTGAEVITIVTDIFKEGSRFYELWAGEIRPDQEEKIK